MYDLKTAERRGVLLGAIWLKFSTQNTRKTNPREIPEEFNFQVEPQMFCLKSCFFQADLVEEEESFREITLFTGSWELGRYCPAVPVVQVFRGTEKSYILQKAKNDNDLVWGYFYHRDREGRFL